MAEDNDMRSETSLVIQWLRVNVPTLIAIGTLIWYTAAQNTRQDERISAIEESRSQRSSEFSKTIADLSGQVSSTRTTLDTLPYRVGQLETGLSDSNKRMDRISETVIQSLDAIRKDIATVSTKVEVLSSKIDTIAPVKKTDLTGPLYPH